MPNIAQQDYIRISVADMNHITASEKAEIAKYAESGTIMDAIIETPVGIARVIAHAPLDKAIVFYNLDDGELGGISY